MQPIVADTLFVAAHAPSIMVVGASEISFDQIYQTIIGSPRLTFAVGCATGAVCAGLVAGFMGRRSRKQLRSQVREATQTAERAEESAKNAERLVQELQRQIRESQRRVAEKKAQRRTERKRTQMKEQRVASAASAKGREATPEASKNEHEADIPVIARGVVSDEPALVTPSVDVTRKIMRTRRAEAIDRRVPRFDESLFPDLMAESTPKVDTFEQAMNAIEDSLSLQVGASGEQTGRQPQFRSPTGQPDFDDPASYVEYLVQDEIRRNKDGIGRRFSRAHLTVFEGTGDLSTARLAARHTPRHMQRVTKEA